jgi:hypothetical protein
VDRTADDIFDEHLQNFTRQQNAANRLQKEFNNYIRCVRGKSLPPPPPPLSPGGSCRSRGPPGRMEEEMRERERE